jgi:hypothetical protein
VRAIPLWLLLVLAGAAATAVLFCFDPSTVHFYPPCLFRLLTGFYCPGCGSLRATHALLHGRLGEAFRLNPLLLISMPVVAGMLVIDPRLKPKYRLSMNPVFPVIVLVVVVAFWIVRNIPLYPFTTLAPH